MERDGTGAARDPGGGVAIAPGVVVPESALEFSYSSSSGPGGQNVNKRATKATLRVRVADIPVALGARDRLRTGAAMYLTGDDALVIQCDEHRSQARNKEGCLERLRAMVVAAMRVPKVRRATRPTRGSRERRLEAKERRSRVKRSRRGDE